MSLEITLIVAALTAGITFMAAVVSDERSRTKARDERLAKGFNSRHNL